MKPEDLAQLDGRGAQIITDLLVIIPSWQDVDLTKKGYNGQYLDTLINVAIYIVKREKKVIEELQK
jgi:hypothetical protein